MGYMMMNEDIKVSKSKYKEVCNLVNEIVELHKKNGAYDAHAYTVGNLTAIVGLMIDGALTRNEAFKALVKTRDSLVK